MEFSSPLSSLFKRKTRGSNSPTSETISPETKRLKESVKEHQVNAPLTIVSSPKTKNNSEDVVLSALDMAQDFASKIDLTLSKLCQLESVGSKMNILQDSADRINQTVANLQSDSHHLKGDIQNTVEETNKLQASVKFLNDEVEAGKKKTLRCRREVKEGDRRSVPPAKKYEVCSRRKNLRFYGIPEIKEEEKTEAVLKTFLEEKLNVENTQHIEFQQVHRVRKREEDTEEVLRSFMARDLGYHNGCSVEIQRVHRLSNRRNTAPCPINARFLRYKHVKEIFSLG